MNTEVIEVTIVKPFNILNVKTKRTVVSEGVEYLIGTETTELGADRLGAPIIEELGLTSLATLLWTSDVVTAWNTHLAAIVPEEITINESTGA